MVNFLFVRYYYVFASFLLNNEMILHKWRFGTMPNKKKQHCHHGHFSYWIGIQRLLISRKAAIIHTRIFLHPYNLCHAGSPRIYCIYEPMPRCLIPSYPVPSAIFITHTSDSELNCIRNVHGAMCGPSERSQNYRMVLLFSFFFRTFWFSTIAGISPVFLDL